MPRTFSFPSHKKAMEMTLNTVIVAVIALLILGLMIFVLARNTTVFNKGTTCATYGGRCVSTCEDPCSHIMYVGKELCNGGDTCCSLVPRAGKSITETAGKIKTGTPSGCTK